MGMVHTMTTYGVVIMGCLNYPQPFYFNWIANCPMFVGDLNTTIDRSWLLYLI
jgi:hypothetical protein